MSTKLTGYVWDGCAASGMKLSSVAIMARLADFSNDEGVCWPSIETIARQIGAGMSTVRTAIARLEAEGWLTRKARRQGNRNASNVYQLNVAKLQAAAFSQLSDSDPSKSDASKSDPSKFDASKSGKKAGFADIRQVETSARYLGTALYWIAASINIKPGHDYYFYVRSVNTVGKSAFVEAVGQPSDDASGYLDFFKGEIGKTHLAQELWTQIDNGQLAPDLTEIRTSITDVSNEITQTVNKKLEDQSAAIQQIQKVQVDTNNNLNSMWAVKLQQMQDGRLYIAGIGAGIENTPDGMQSQVLLAADRIAMINPANGNTKPMFVGQGDQIFMNEVFLKRLTAPTITSGGNPPAFSLTSDGRLTAKNADISGSVNANSGTLNNVTINQNCTIKGMLEATQVRGDFVKAVSKAFPKKVGTWGNTETPNGTVTVTISDDHNFDRQIIIPPIIFNGIAYDDPGSGNNPGGTRYTGYGFEVRKNGVLIASRETKGAIPGSYSAVIDMPSGRGSVTLEFKIFQKGNQGAGNITDCTVIVTKKAASGISIR